MCKLNYSAPVSKFQEENEVDGKILPSNEVKRKTEFSRPKQRAACVCRPPMRKEDDNVELCVPRKMERGPVVT